MGPYILARRGVAYCGVYHWLPLLSMIVSATFPRSAKDALDEDPVIRGRPVVLQSKDGHALWISKMVLQRSGPLPRDVEGGIVVRDEPGNPTGSLGPLIPA
jgi:predicted amidohydrolase YtcJ